MGAPHPSGETGEGAGQGTRIWDKGSGAKGDFRRKPSGVNV